MSREELEELGERIHGLSGPLYESHGERFTDKAELLALLDMASRAVSIETLRRLQSLLVAVENGHPAIAQYNGEIFASSAIGDLREAAEALARPAGEGKP